ncbi:MAG: MarR family transcriptional regulator [Bacilli bacterium]|nr:MarR family transcriptional regulator [Bacilli bacterium]
MEKYLKANVVFSKFSRDYMALKKDLPIRPSEMGVLNIITKREGLFTPVMIADLLEVTKPMVANHISVLEEKGYITKQYSENDKRSFYIIPTDKAKKLVEEAETKLNKKLINLEKKLGSKRFDELIKILEEAKSYLED